MFPVLTVKYHRQSTVSVTECKSYGKSASHGDRLRRFYRHSHHQTYALVPGTETLDMQQGHDVRQKASHVNYDWSTLMALGKL